jgi:DNA-binding CsgD family transcriptional regulator
VVFRLQPEQGHAGEVSDVGPDGDGPAASEQVVRLVGRAAEREEFESWGRQLRSGASAFLITGPAGVGKTAMWSYGVQRLSRQIRVLTCRSDELGHALSYSCLADLLEGTGEALGDLPRLFRDTLGQALHPGLSDTSVVDHPAVALAVSELLRRVAAAGPVVLAIDDLQWLDRASARVVQFVLRRLHELPIGVLATRRGATIPALLASSLPDHQVITCDLRGLTLAEMDRLIVVRMGVALRRPALSQIHEASGGNPLYSLELARARLRSGIGEAGERPHTSTLAELIGTRVAAVGRQTGETLLVVAAQPRPTVTSVVELLGPSAVSALEHAVDAGLLDIVGDRLRFTHPLLGAAVLESADAGRRRKVHAALASSTVDAEQRGRHLSQATAVGDERVSALIEEAAVAAWTRGAPDAAADLAERAAELTPAVDRAGWVRRTTAAADYAWGAGDDERCTALLSSLHAAMPPGSDRAEVLRRLAMREAMTSSFASAAALLRKGVQEAGEDTVTRGALKRDLAFALMQGADVRDSQEPAAEGLRCALVAGDRDEVADAQAIVWLGEVVGGRRPDTAEFAAQLEVGAGSESRDRWLPSGSRRVLLGTVLKWVDRFDSARRTLEQAYRTHWDRQEDGVLVPALFQLAELECWAGRYDEADRLGDLALQTERRLPRRDTVRPMRLHPAALAAARRGRLEEASSLATEQLELATRTSDGRNQMRALATLGFVALCADRPPEAVAHLSRAESLRRDLGHEHPGVLRCSADHVEALLANGETAEAERALERFAAQSAACASPWGLATASRCRGLLALTGDNREAAVGLLTQAVRNSRLQPDPLETGRTLLALGNGLRRARHRVESRTALHQAASIFAGLGADVWLSRANAELARAGEVQRPPGGSSTQRLTPTQSSVADLIALGRSNKEIAAQLFISTKTVEAHLSAIYRELGLRSRTELAASRLGRDRQGFP